MAQLGSKNKPAVVRVQTEERAVEIFNLCNEKGWQVIIGIEPDNKENIDDVLTLQGRGKLHPFFTSAPSQNAPCSCGSGKQYKRCCGK
jgi:SWIM/SEC-C metal-binding protein